MGWGDPWGEDDVVILDDDGRSVGRIYKDTKVDLVGEHLTVSRSSPEQRLGSNA
jgi:hypothetical protein